ncbi:MAG: BspA family leucine-rich repeat surface protein [Bacteroidales bacterium]
MNLKIIITILFAILTTLIVSCGPSKRSGDPMILIFNTHYGEGNSVTLPLTGKVDVHIDWGDGHTARINEPGPVTHSYGKAGRFTVRISGSLSHFGTGETPYPNVEKLRRVRSFGNLGLKSLSGAFNQVSLLVSLPDSLPASVTDLSWLFAGAELFNLEPGHWDVGNVTNMTGMFSGAASFNQPLNNWNTGRTTAMQKMFAGAESFNQPLGKWDVSNVTNMTGMFRNAVSFDQPLGQWDISLVTNMENMFRGGRLSPENYNDLLTGWTSLPVRVNVTFHAGESIYSSERAASARRNLIERNRWKIFDGQGYHIMAVSKNGQVAGQGTYPAGDTITLRAIPDPGYHFDHWEGWGTEASEDSLHTIVVDGPLRLRAHFAPADPNDMDIGTDTSQTAYRKPPGEKKPETNPEVTAQDKRQLTDEEESESGPQGLPDLSELDHEEIELWFRMDEPFSDYIFAGGKYPEPDQPKVTPDQAEVRPDSSRVSAGSSGDYGLRFFVLNQDNEFLYVSPGYRDARSIQADVFRYTTDGYVPTHELDPDSHTPDYSAPLIIVTSRAGELGSHGGSIYFLENSRVREIGDLHIARYQVDRNLDPIYTAIGNYLVIEKENGRYQFRFNTDQVAYRPNQMNQKILDASSCYYRYDGNKLEFVEGNPPDLPREEQ